MKSAFVKLQHVNIILTIADNDIKRFVDYSKISKLGENFVFFFLSFEEAERGGFCAVQLQSDTFGEIWSI